MKLYNDLPHMLIPVVTDPKRVPSALKWLIGEMERRYQLFANYGVRNIAGFNEKLKKMTPSELLAESLEHLPYIVCIIDDNHAKRNKHLCGIPIVGDRKDIPEMVKQYKIAVGSNFSYYPLAEKDLWYCSCGALNHEGEDCHVCRRTLFELQTIDLDQLAKDKDTRLAQEAAAAEAKAAAAKARWEFEVKQYEDKMALERQKQADKAAILGTLANRFGRIDIGFKKDKAYKFGSESK
jgi:hypothetical protein